MKKKKDFLKKPVQHIDFTTLNATPVIDAMRKMSFTARELANAADIYDRMLADPGCTIFLTIAGSTSAAGCMQVYSDLVKYNMVDAIVATGASIVDMDFFEALGFKHYQGTPNVDDQELRRQYIDRIYDTYIDEEQLQACDKTVGIIADKLDPRPYSSREFIAEMGKYLTKKAKKKTSLVQVAYENDVPIFCPAFSDSSAGFGLVLHQRQPSRQACLHRLGEGLPGTDADQDAGADLGAPDDRRGRAQELRPGYGHLRGSAGEGSPHAPVRHSDHRRRCPRRGLFQFDPERGILLGEGRYDLRTDGLRGSDLGDSAPCRLRLRKGQLERPEKAQLREDLR